MFFIDDLLLRSLGLSLQGLDLIWTLEQIQRFAFKELYNTEKIKSQIKETRMLYEFGELTREEYERRNRRLMRNLDLAAKAQEMDLGSRMDILG